MNKNVENLKKILKEGLNCKRDYSHTIILEERKNGRLYISQYIPLKIHKENNLYSGIHVQSIEIDPEYPDRIYFYQYLNKRDEIEEKVFGLNTPTFETGWSRSISSLKGLMKIKEREEKGEILFEDNFSKLKPLVVNWEKDLKPNTKEGDTTMYALYWDLGAENKLYYFLTELGGVSDRDVVNRETDLEKVSELLVDDEEYEYLDLLDDQELLIPAFIMLMNEDKQLRHIIRSLASEDGKDHYEATDYVKKDKEEKKVETPKKEKEDEIGTLHSTHFTILLDKLLDCEIDIPAEDTKYLINFLMKHYKGDNLKFIINKLTEE